VHAHAEEHRDARPEHDLEREELQGDRSRLAQEDAGGVDPREPQAVAGSLTRLHGDAALDGEDGREEEGDPEDAGCSVV